MDQQSCAKKRKGSLASAAMAKRKLSSNLLNEPYQSYCYRSRFMFTINFRLTNRHATSYVYEQWYDFMTVNALCSANTSGHFTTFRPFSHLLVKCLLTFRSLRLPNNNYTFHQHKIQSMVSRTWHGVMAHNNS